jgi:hypothetical protein
MEMEDALANPIPLRDVARHIIVSGGAVLNRGTASDLEMLRLIRKSQRNR